MHIVFRFRVLQFNRGKEKKNTHLKGMKTKTRHPRFHTALMLCTLLLAEPRGQWGVGIWDISQGPFPSGSVMKLDSAGSPTSEETKRVTVQ